MEESDRNKYLHQCSFHKNSEEMNAEALHFLIPVLIGNYKIFFIANDGSGLLFYEELCKRKIQFEKAIQCGGLIFLNAESTVLFKENKLSQMVFDVKRFVRIIENEIEMALFQGYQGVSLVMQTDWLWKYDIPISEFYEYEKAFNRLFCAGTLRALCQFDINKVESQVLREILNLHSVVRYRTRELRINEFEKEIQS